MSAESFDSLIPVEALDDVLQAASEFGIDPTTSGAEAYFANLVDQNRGRPGLREFVRARLQKEVRVCRQFPEWIQNPDWPFANDKPMTFVGQIDRTPAETGMHDDASFYVFWSPETGETKTIIQVG